MLSPRHGRSRPLRKRLEEEARRWEPLDHANILPFYGLVELRDELHLVTPWAKYRDLTFMLRERLLYPLKRVRGRKRRTCTRLAQLSARFVRRHARVSTENPRHTLGLNRPASICPCRNSPPSCWPLVLGTAGPFPRMALSRAWTTNYSRLCQGFA